MQIPLESFGRGECTPFNGGMNHRGLAYPVKYQLSCTKGSPNVDAIVLESSSKPFGTFDLHYRQYSIKHISVSVSAIEQRYLLGSLPIRFDILEVSERQIHDQVHGVAWTLRYYAEDHSLDNFTVDDQLVDGYNAKVGVYRVFNITTIAKGNDLRGDFRIVLSNQYTDVVSFQSTARKVQAEIESLKGVGKTLILKSDCANEDDHVEFTAIVDDDLNEIYGHVFTVRGDITIPFRFLQELGSRKISVRVLMVKHMCYLR